MFTSLLVIALVGQVAAQNVRPQIGYMYPPGGRVGTTIDVMLGTYDWTPDMQVFVHFPAMKLEITGSAGEFMITPPPYWFGNKASLAQPPLAREVPAKLTIPAETPFGPVSWQVANANGGSNLGTFIISEHEQFVEPEWHEEILELPTLPIAVSGRIGRITECDTYRFHTANSGLITCRLEDRLGQPFNGVMTVRNELGRIVADVANTVGRKEATAMFQANTQADYTVTVHDVNFGGDRGYVYRLTIEQGPRVLATIPSVIARGQTTMVKFIGWGVASNKLQLESINEPVAVPETTVNDVYVHSLTTAHGPIFVKMLLDVASDSLEPESLDLNERHIACPMSLTGALSDTDPTNQSSLDRYLLTAKKGDMLRIKVETARLGSRVDPSIAIVTSAGKELVRSDDLPDSVDAVIDFNVPEDDVYQLIVADYSSESPSLANIYRLVVENQEDAADLTVQVPERLDIPLGGQAELVVKTIRRGDWDEPITLSLDNLPAGVSAGQMVLTPLGADKPGKRINKAGAKESKITLTASGDIAAGSQLATLVATANINERIIVRRSQPLLVSTILKTRCKVKSAVQDGGKIVNRGTTYPADLIIERLEGYEGPIQLQMASTQQRQRRGIYGPQLLVPSGVERVQYPVFMPEWLETSLTARMNVFGVAQVADPLGNVRHVTGIMDGFIVMSLEGALLKLTHEPRERIVKLGAMVEIPLKVSRSAKLLVPARIDLALDSTNQELELATCDAVLVPESTTTATIRLQLSNDPQFVGNHLVKFRATALKDGRWPTIAETTVPLIINEPLDAK